MLDESTSREEASGNRSRALQPTASHFHRNASTRRTTVDDSRLGQAFFAISAELVYLEDSRPIRVSRTAFGTDLSEDHMHELP